MSECMGVGKTEEKITFACTSMQWVAWAMYVFAIALSASAVFIWQFV